MDESTWLKCTDPDEMLGYVFNKVSARKAHLLACGCARQVWSELDADTRKAFEVTELYADGHVSERNLDQDTMAAHAVFASGRTHDELNTLQLLRDVFGNPFHPASIDPAILTWNHGTVPGIARHIYDERAFGDLPILADALEDAGCTDADILGHCRAGGEHVRGCWVVELILGKK
jgi:hypothetical protein